VTGPALDTCAVCGAPISPESYTKRVLVVTEGLADAEFLRKLVQYRGIADLQTTRPARGKDFRKKLEAMRAIVPDTATVLIVTDSDTSYASTFRMIQDQIRSIGDYAVPPNPLVVARAKGVPSIAVLTLPWVDRDGSLETLLLDAMSETAATVVAAVDGMLQATVRRSRGISKDSKARLACTVACVCDDDPSCAVSTMWKASRGFEELLGQRHFDQIAGFLQTL